jgi:hypothetical protein
MDRKNILKQIKNLIKFSEHKFIDAKLTDNETIVQAEGDTFEVGAQLSLVTPDGLIPAPAGEHTTLEGVKIYVDEAGIITEIQTVELGDMVEPEMPAAVEETLAEVDEEVAVEDENVENMYKKKMEEMEARIAEVEKMMNEMLPVVKQASEFSNDVLTKLDTFVKETPAEVQFSSIKSEYKEFVRDNKERKMNGLEGIKNIRKK